VSTPNESPEPVVHDRTLLGIHVPNEGIREWFAREDWLLTESEVRIMLTLRRSIAARYYNEWGLASSGT
jgi:hypothetical protein